MSSSCRSALCAAGLGLFSAQVAGAGWEFEPRIEVLALHDDNYRLTDIPGREIEVTGGSLDAELAFRLREPRTLVEIRPRVRTSVFPDEEQEESTDSFLAFGWEHRTQRLEARIDADYSDESVVTSELLPADSSDVDLGETISGDSGRVNIRNRRELIRLRPALSYNWTPRRKVEAGFSYLDAAYDENIFEQTGYTDTMVSGGIVFDLSQRDALTARLRGGTYEPEGAFADTERAAIEGEWTRYWSPITRVYVRGGVEFTETDVRMLDARRQPITMPVSESSFVGGVGAEWRYQVTEIVFDAVRSVAPSSAGVVMDRNELRLRMRREVRARLAVFGNLRSVRTQGAVEDIAPVRDRDYLAGKLGFEWRMTRPLRVIGAYDYAWQEFEGEPADATSNAISISFVYEPRRRD